MVITEEVEARLPTTHSDQPRISPLINDNYCVTKRGLLKRAGGTETFTSVNIDTNVQTLNVYCHVVNHVPCVTGLPQKKGVTPIVKPIKSVKGVSSVDQLSFVHPVINVHKICMKGQTAPVLNPQARLHPPSGTDGLQ